MKKQLQVWNGRGHGYYKGESMMRYHFSVAAYSRAHAARLINGATDANISSGEIKNYYSDCWGNDLASIEPKEPCLYAKINGKPLIKIV